MTQTRPDRTLGPGHDDFWNGTAKGELRLPECRACHALIWPVAAKCEECGGEAFDWKALTGRGKLVSWCTFDQDYYRGLLPLPWETILVELEEGPLFISNPQGFSLDEARLDMAVEVTFIDCADSAGSFALPVFVRA